MHAYDTDDTIAGRLVENERMSGTVDFHHVDIAEVDEFPTAKIVYSTYTLGLLGHRRPGTNLDESWWRRYTSPRRGDGHGPVRYQRHLGRLVPTSPTLPLHEIDAMFRGFQIIDRTVRDEDGRFLADKKHWHVITDPRPEAGLTSVTLEDQVPHAGQASHAF